MTSVDSNFNFLWTSTWGWTPLPPSTCVHLSLTPYPPPCGRHKWMVPWWDVAYSSLCPKPYTYKSGVSREGRSSCFNDPCVVDFEIFNLLNKDNWKKRPCGLTDDS